MVERFAPIKKGLIYATAIEKANNEVAPKIIPVIDHQMTAMVSKARTI